MKKELLTGIRNGVYLLSLTVAMLFTGTPGASGQASSATRPLKGRVVDQQTKDPLIGAAVWVKESSVGTSTGVDGSFTLNVPSGKSVEISASYIGYTTAEIVVEKTAGEVVIEMVSGSEQIETVQVVGYGVQRRESVIGSISTITRQELQAPSGSISTNIAGKLAGIVSFQRNGEPGSSAEFWIRGISTFGAGRNPLVLVDGVERSMDLLDPEEIESFSILKDATATAVYGVRGANGVLLITTRRGEEGKAKINIKVESGITTFTKRPKMANSMQFAEVYNEVLGYDHYTPETIEAYRTGIDPDLYPNVDWVNEIFSQTASNQRVTASVSGGGSIARYYISGGYYHEKGMYNSGGTYSANPNYARYNFRSNLDVNLTPSTVLALTLGGFMEQRRGPAESGGVTRDAIWSGAMMLAPNVYPVEYSDGRLAGKKDSSNPWNLINEWGYSNRWTNTLNSLISLEQDFSKFVTKGLKATVKFSFDADNNHNNVYTRNREVWYATGRDPQGDLIFGSGKPEVEQTQPSYSRTSSGSNATYLEGSITYDRNFNGHRVGGLLLYNQRRYVASASSAINSLPYKNQGLAGRVTYSYDNRYFVEGNFGYNGSENFAPGHRLGFFPSVAVGWILSEEKFFMPLKRVVSKLKFKASVGQVGNDKIEGVRFIYLGTVAGSGGYTYGNYSGGYGQKVGEIPNNNVSWEVSTKQNYGFELTLFNRLEIQGDWFKDMRRNIFVRRYSMPDYVGMSTIPMVNIGEMESWGYDLTADFRQNIGDFHLSVKGTFTYATNKIINNGEADNIYPYMDAKGQKIYQNRGFVALGLFSSQEEIDRSPVQFSESVHGTLRPGDIKYKDINGDHVINDFDRVPIGRSDVPEIFYGFGASMDWKGIDLSFFLQGVGRVTSFESGNTLVPFSASSIDMSNFHEDVYLHRWTEANPDPNARYPRANNVQYDSNNNAKQSTFWQKDASYLRLRNAEIGYTLPYRWTQKIRMRSCRIYLSGVNLLTFSRELNLFDPELGTTDGRKYPPTRVFSAGLNLNF